MSSNRISFQQAQGTGALIRDYVATVERVLAEGDRLVGILNSSNFGNDTAGVEAEVGGMVPGTGTTLLTILTNAQNAMKVAATAELARLDRP